MGRKKQIDWVLNKSDKAYKEDFRGTVITVPPNGKKAVKMKRRDRIAFFAQYKPFNVEDKNDIDSPGVKPLYWQIAEAGEYEDQLVCTVCGLKFESQTFLENHLETHKGQPAAVAPK